MCGIVGYLGGRPARPVLIEGLKRLEYRGYDSAGLATVEPGSAPVWSCHKRAGKVAELEKSLGGLSPRGTLGIAHTRWATHGEPSERNAHPHCSSGEAPWPPVAVVHNGIIENHEALRAQLRAEGFAFASDTDSEVLPHLIDRELRRGANSLEGAVSGARAHIEGAYAIAGMSYAHPDELVAACNSSPLVIGIGKDELFVASDELAFAGKATSVLHLKDGEIVVLKRNGSYTFRGVPLPEALARVEKPAVSAHDAVKSGYAHFMLKEIHEQPQSLRQTFAGRLHESEVVFGGLTGDLMSRLQDARRIVLVGCGTSLYAAHAGKLLIEKFARKSVEVVQASEFCYGDPVLSSQDVVIGISQSGTTADTLATLELARERHALVLGITNRVGSTLAKRVRAGVYLHAGPEIAVASTKAFTSQVAVLAMLAAKLAPAHAAGICAKLKSLPAVITEVLKADSKLKRIAWQFAAEPRAIVLGRGFGVPLALEGALKLTEVAYVDGHGYSAAELKHGPLALVERGTPVIAIVPADEEGVLARKMLSNLSEVSTRGGHVVALVGKGGPATCMARYRVELPAVAEELAPIAYAPALQLLAYYWGIARGINVDQPRNLAKSVTVE